MVEITTERFTKLRAADAVRAVYCYLQQRTAIISGWFCCYIAVGVAGRRVFPRRWLDSWLFFRWINSDISDRGSILHSSGNAEPCGFG
jgi:hypothetical protein